VDLFSFLGLEDEFCVFEFKSARVLTVEDLGEDTDGSMLLTAAR
jgi:hypothetical protein